MNTRKMMLTAMTLLSLVVLALPGQAGTLDDYYLQQFGESPGSALKSVAESATEQLHARCGMPLKHDLRRDWNKLEPSSHAILAKQLSAPVLENEATLTSAHFVIHYATSGTDAPTPAPPYSVSTWVSQVAASFETALSTYQGMGYQAPPGAPYHVYLRSLSALRIYGQTTTSAAAPSASFPNAYTSFIEIDKDFTAIIYTRAASPLESLQITSAHEFHHTIQFGYNVFFDVWYAEATSTWYEGELYPAVLQYYSYVHPWLVNSTRRLDLAVDANAVTTGAGYGRWIFNRYLTEQHSSGIVRSIWERLAPLPSPGGSSDIPMLPVINAALAGGLQADFLGFARRVYRQEDWPQVFDTTSATLRYVPLATYSSYPVNILATPKPEVFLEQYSFAYYRFAPPASTTLNVFVNGTPGIVARAFRKDATTQAITEFPFSTVYPSSVTITNANTASEIVLLLANSSDSTTQNANFSTDGTTQATAPVTATPPPATTPVTSAPTGGDGGGGGCFIATAAYGSYLHPQVRILREFRDVRLLTNAPGRAFVALYYHISPPLADFIAHHGALRLLVRLLLTPVVLAVVHPAAAVALLLAVTCGVAGRVRWKRSSPPVRQKHAV